jgi:hypothetical protein
MTGVPIPDHTRLTVDLHQSRVAGILGTPLVTFMEIAAIAISNLRLNPHNDRHGALRDEPSAIHWLLENRTIHMRALAADLATTKRSFAFG